MASKRKFKRDYIILEAKDTNFRYKERILPKAFAKVEINDEKSVVSLYVENLKCVKDGYRVIAIQSDYETLDLGKVVLSEQGKGEFVLNLDRDDIDLKGIALLYEKSVPLIGFKGSKIENYEDILFTVDDEEFEEYEEVEYIEVDDDEDEEFDDEDYEYEEIEYIEIEEEDDEGYEEIEDNDGYIEIQEDEEEEEEEEEIEDEYEEDEEEDEEQIIERNLYKQKSQPQKTKQQRKPKYASQYQEPKPQNIPYQSYEQYQQKSRNSNAAGALLMPRQIKKGLKYFNEVKPFVSDDIEDTRWWKVEISPTTLCGYTMPHLGYVNSLNYTMYSDAVMHSYKYRHYLFGVQYDEYNKRKSYIYAVPGNKNEQPDKGHTGFNTYQACDTRNDSLGYWLCFIDSRSRRILK